MKLLSFFFKNHFTAIIVIAVALNIKPLGESLRRKKLFTQSEYVPKDCLLIIRGKLVALQYSTTTLFQWSKANIVGQLSLCAWQCNAVRRIQLHLCSIPAKNP